MIGLYYRIWVDGMARAKSLPANKNNWKLGTMLLMSLAMMMNLALIMTILQKYVVGFYFYKLNLTFLPRELDNAISFIVLFILPCVVINYLLIFYNKRYEFLLKRYSTSYNGKLFITYFAKSLILPVLLIGVAMFFT